MLRVIVKLIVGYNKRSVLLTSRAYITNLRHIKAFAAHSAILQAWFTNIIRRRDLLKSLYSVFSVKNTAVRQISAFKSCRCRRVIFCPQHGNAALVFYVYCILVSVYNFGISPRERLIHVNGQSTVALKYIPNLFGIHTEISFIRLMLLFLSAHAHDLSQARSPPHP